MDMNGSTDTSVRSNIWKLYVIRALSGCLIAIPVIVLIFQSAGLTLREIYLLQAIFGATILLLEVPSGYLSDQWGRKKTLIVSFATGTIGWIVYTQAHDFYGFVAAEICIGIGASLFSGTFEAMTYDTLLELKEEGAYRKISRNQMSIDLSAEAGCALLGGLVALWSLEATLWLSAVAFAGATAFSCMLQEPRRHKPQERTTSHWKALWDVCVHTLLTHRGLRSITVIGGIIGAMTLMLFWFTQPYQKAIEFPLYLWGVSHAVIVLAGAVAAQYAGWLEERADDRKILMGVALTVVGCYLALSALPPHWAFLGLFLLSRVAWCIMGPLTTDIINRITTSDIRATVLSLSSFGGRLIFICASPLIASLADDHGIPFALYVTGIASGGLLLVVFIRLRTVWDELPR